MMSKFGLHLKEFSFTNYLSLRFLALFFIGFANALYIPLMGSSLSIWLAEAGLRRDVIGFFALFALPSSIKILWTPIVNYVSLPFCEKIQRKIWLLIGVWGMSACLFGISCIDPSQQPWLLGGCLSLLSFFAGCFYMVGISYELESLDDNSYAMGSAHLISGYRIGLLSAGAGALYMASLWDWKSAYQFAAALLAVGSLIIIFLPEPYRSAEVLSEKKRRLTGNSYVSLFWKETVVDPCRNFFQKLDWLTIVLLLLVFKMSDQMLRSMEGPFFLSLGFTKADLAAATKMWGMAATIAGAFIAGISLRQRDPFLSLAVIGALHASALFCYFGLSLLGKNYLGLYLTVAAENFTGGMAITAFISLLWKICDKQYAALQYALMWSFFTFKGDVLSALGGLLAAHCSWPMFFANISLIGLVSSLVVVYLVKIRQRALVLDGR